MDIGHERHLATGGADAGGDVFEIGRINLGLCGDTDDFTSYVRQTQNLRHAGCGVAGV